MMKQQQSAIKLSLSRLCRTIMVLALVKISLFVTMVWDSSLINFDTVSLFNASSVAEENTNSSSSNMAFSVENNTTLQSQNLDAQIAAMAKNNKYITSVNADGTLNYSTQQAPAQNKNTPNAANWDTNNGTFPVSTLVQGGKNSSPSFFTSKDNVATLEYELLSSGIDSSNVQSPNVGNKQSWWKNMLSIKNLPIPGFGTASVAHAAALDNPPAPNLTSPSGITNFTPNSQRVGQEQNMAQRNKPYRGSNNPPVAAGSAGPNISDQATNFSDIPQTISPPVPNINTYSPPEDPNFKQKELARREQELLMLKKQMEQRYSELQAAEERVNKLLKNVDNVNQQKSSNLVSVYANMKPKQAAIALGKIDPRVAVQILSGLKPKQAGEILSYADPEITAKLTELLNRGQ